MTGTRAGSDNYHLFGSSCMMMSATPSKTFVLGNVYVASGRRYLMGRSGNTFDLFDMETGIGYFSDKSKPMMTCLVNRVHMTGHHDLAMFEDE